MTSNAGISQLRRIIGYSLVAVFACSIAACASNKPYQINLMDAPDIYDEGGIDPFRDPSPIALDKDFGLLYCTDRLPAPDQDKAPYYLNERGHVLRLGISQARLAKEGVTWEEARRISLLKNRTENYPIQVSEVQEFGILDRTITALDDPEMVAGKSDLPARQFAEQINKQLANSLLKDIFVYVHGFKVNFENPLLVASELWHYMGYEGVFIAYAWPSTPSVWAYASDLETTVATARNLRILLEYLAQETDADRIHVVAYSAGTRVATNALWQLALQHTGDSKEAIQEKLKLGQVILVGSDVDKDIFGNQLVDGIWKVPAHLTVYLSESDQALGMSRWFFRRERLGQWEEGKVPAPAVAQVLRNHNDLIAINVTDAEKAAKGNGHAYFRNSPWVSSDILMTLRYGLLPDQRGLVRTDEDPIWYFPPNYIAELREIIFEVNPELAQRAHKP